MATVKHHKVVASLPAELEPDALYMVRRGEGFDLYVTNHSGVIVPYPLNAPSAAASFFGLVTVTASSTGQTEFAIPGGYTPGAIVVFLNGASLAPVHYTASDGATVVLASGAGVVPGTELVVLRLSAFEVADALPLMGTAQNSLRYGGVLPPPEDGKQYALKDGAWVEVEASGGGSGLPVLTPGWTLSRNGIGDGYAAQDGQLLSRATYPDAWAQAQAIGMVITDAEWLADPLKRGMFSDGDGSTTFRLPDANGKQAGSLGAVFLRGDGALSAGTNGEIQRDAIQNITGTLQGTTTSSIALASGAFANIAGQTNLIYASGTAYSAQAQSFDASRVARTSSETRALNLTVVWTIKLFGAVVNVGSADAAQLASDFANMNAALQALDGQIDFTIIYPNGGSEASPANVTTNSRYVAVNPFPGFNVICQAEILIGGRWYVPGWYSDYSAGSRAYGVRACSDGTELVVQTGIHAIATNGRFSGGTYAGNDVTAPSPCRVKVWKVKGAIA